MKNVQLSSGDKVNSEAAHIKASSATALISNLQAHKAAGEETPSLLDFCIMHGHRTYSRDRTLQRSGRAA